LTSQKVICASTGSNYEIVMSPLNNKTRLFIRLLAGFTLTSQSYYLPWFAFDFWNVKEAYTSSVWQQCIRVVCVREGEEGSKRERDIITTFVILQSDSRHQTTKLLFARKLWPWFISPFQYSFKVDFHIHI